jgi:hypothetical protein
MAENVECRNCAGAEWVCEEHMDMPWGGLSSSPHACNCGGAGAPCPACSRSMACAGYSEPWRELALRAIRMVEDAVKDTNWGQPTFGPDYGEELRAEYDALLAKARGEA